MRITLHADDLGATDNVNSNILAVWSAGALDSVSVIANGNAVQQAAAYTSREPALPLRIMVHLNLSEGAPLTEARGASLLTDSDGRFNLGFIGLAKRWGGLDEAGRREFLAQVEREFTAQVERVRQLFHPRPIAGVDGHIHVHMLPFLFPLAAKIAAAGRLGEIRVSRELFHFSLHDSLRAGYVSNIAKHLLLNRLAVPAAKVAADFGLAAPDRIAGVLYSGHMSRASATAAIRAARAKRLKWLELIFHPGRATAAEMQRWQSQVNIGRFYANPHRDMERNELLAAGATLRDQQESGQPEG